jgi:hypothetical protein
MFANSKPSMKSSCNVETMLYGAFQGIRSKSKNFSSYNTQIIVVDGHSNDGTEENADFIAEAK